jgi:hypothetical protein
MTAVERDLESGGHRQVADRGIVRSRQSRGRGARPDVRGRQIEPGERRIDRRGERPPRILHPVAGIQPGGIVLQRRRNGILLREPGQAVLDLLVGEEDGKLRRKAEVDLERILGQLELLLLDRQIALGARDLELRAVDVGARHAAEAFLDLRLERLPPGALEVPFEVADRLFPLKQPEVALDDADMELDAVEVPDARRVDVAPLGGWVTETMPVPV